MRGKALEVIKDGDGRWCAGVKSGKGGRREREGVIEANQLEEHASNEGDEVAVVCVPVFRWHGF